MLESGVIKEFSQFIAQDGVGAGFGVGIIAPDDGGPDVWVFARDNGGPSAWAHVSAGDTVEYEAAQMKRSGRKKAIGVKFGCMRNIISHTMDQVVRAVEQADDVDRRLHYSPSRTIDSIRRCCDVVLIMRAPDTLPNLSSHVGYLCQQAEVTGHGRMSLIEPLIELLENRIAMIEWKAKLPDETAQIEVECLLATYAFIKANLRDLCSSKRKRT
jgi:cold shock CspA family protein